MKLTRRDVLIGGLATAASVHSSKALGAVPRPPSAANCGPITSQLRLSCAAYSFRDYLPRGDNKGTMTLHDWLDLSASYGLDAVEPTSYYFSSEENEYLHSLKAKAFKLGLDISGTAVGNNFCLPPGDARNAEIAMVKRWVDHSVEFGAPCIRIFAGREPKDADRETTFKWACECTKECCDYAGSRGVFLAIENHGYMTESADEVIRIVEAVKHDWLGVNLDTGNFKSDPYANMEKLLPYTITAQVKIEVVSADGKGREEADFVRIAGILRKANYRGYVALEYEAKEDPMTGVPKYLDKIRKAIA